MSESMSSSRICMLQAAVNFVHVLDLYQSGVICVLRFVDEYV